MSAKAFEWWRGRSTREQTLLIVCVGVLAFALAYFGAFKPALDWRAQAIQRTVTRETEFRLVSDAARGALDAAAAPGVQTPVRNALTDAATLAGVELVFVNAREDGSVEAQIGSAPPDKLFVMIEALERQNGVRVIGADIARVSDGAATVRAQLTFSR